MTVREYEHLLWQRQQRAKARAKYRTPVWDWLGPVLFTLAMLGHCVWLAWALTR